MKKMHWYGIAVLVLLIAMTVVYFKTEKEAAAAVKQLFPLAVRVEKVKLSDINGDSFAKLYLNQIDRAFYAYDASGSKTGMGFIAKGYGYSGEMTVAVAIDTGTKQVTGIRIVKHRETSHYGGFITESWFTDRFKAKSIDQFLGLTALEAESEQDIIQVTGATMSSRAVVDAVNTAISACQFLELNNKMAKPVINVQQEKKAEEETFYIKYGGNQSIKVTMEELKGYPAVKVACILQKTTGTKIKMVAEGPLLDTVLQKHGVRLSDFEGIGITGRDGYYALVPKDIMQKRQIILGHIFDGKPILEEEKPIRVVIPEEFGVYWVKMVSDIDLYDDIPEKNIKSVKVFDALTRDIKPYPFEYYGKKDASVEVGKILAKFKQVDEKGFFTMVSSDGLVKSETIAMVKQRYYIKIEGENAPMNVMANFKLGTNVKYMACFSTTEDAVIFPQEMVKLTGTAELGGKSGMPLAQVMEKAGMMKVKDKFFEAVSAAGEKLQLKGNQLDKCILAYADKKVTLLYESANGVVEVKDLLEVKVAEAGQ